ncbi:hypothetical protein V8C42DRAFT_317599 [Trichoderma barbatum]
MLGSISSSCSSCIYVPSPELIVCLICVAFIPLSAPFALAQVLQPRCIKHSIVSNTINHTKCMYYTYSNCNMICRLGSVLIA